MASSVALGFCFAVGIVLRLSLFRTSIPEWLSSRKEISNPLTSWEKALEGVALAENDISPYIGDLFHETPLLLRLFALLTKILPTKVHYFFVFVDVLSGLAIVNIGRSFGSYLLQKQVSEVKSYDLGATKLILKREDMSFLQFAMVATHFLNPYSIAVCLGKSTAVINNLFVFLAFMFMLKGNKPLCLLAVAMAAYESLYPIMLLVPAAIFFYDMKATTKDKKSNSSMLVTSGFVTLTFGLLIYVGLLFLSYILEGSSKFLGATVGFILGAPDLTPNLGVFWYFFTEMFEHFRPFFICVFQINAFLYTVPLAFKLRDHPVFLAYVLVALMSIFKSYPSYADVSLMLTLLPMWLHVFKYMRNLFMVTNMFLACTILSPILWHLWIYSGSANANFYFAIALTFSTAQIFLVTDLLFAFLRREYDLQHGIKPKLPDGAEGEAQIILD